MTKTFIICLLIFALGSIDTLFQTYKVMKYPALINDCVNA